MRKLTVPLRPSAQPSRRRRLLRTRSPGVFVMRIMAVAGWKARDGGSITPDRDTRSTGSTSPLCVELARHNKPYQLQVYPDDRHGMSKSHNRVHGTHKLFEVLKSLAK